MGYATAVNIHPNAIESKPSAVYRPPLRIRLLRPNAVAPEYKSDLAAGLDLCFVAFGDSHLKAAGNDADFSGR